MQDISAGSSRGMSSKQQPRGTSLFVIIVVIVVLVDLQWRVVPKIKAEVSKIHIWHSKVMDKPQAMQVTRAIEYCIGSLVGKEDAANVPCAGPSNVGERDV